MFLHNNKNKSESTCVQIIAKVESTARVKIPMKAFSGWSSAMATVSTQAISHLKSGKAFILPVNMNTIINTMI